MNLATTKQFGDVTNYFPGVRAKVPLTLSAVHPRKAARRVRRGFRASRQARCVSRRATIRWSRRRRKNSPTRSAFRTSIRWSDKELAFIHYLFKADLGGTAFYRHRKTGFEYIDFDRRPEYLRHHRRRESLGPDYPPAEYINGDTPLYEQISAQRRRFQSRVDLSTEFAAFRGPRPELRCRPESQDRAPVDQRLSGISAPLIRGFPRPNAAFWCLMLLFFF